MSGACCLPLLTTLIVLLASQAPAGVLAPLEQAARLAQGGGNQGGPLPGLPGLPDLTEWAKSVFDAALASFGQDLSRGAVGLLNGLLGSRANVINQTPPALSYQNDAVRTLWGTSRAAANVMLAVIAAWGGINLIVNPHLRAPYHGVLELLPRLALGGLLVNTSIDWGSFVIDVNNALCEALGTGSLPGLAGLLLGLNGGLLNVIAILVYIVMGLLLLVQMLMRLALVDVLLVVAPLALLCWVLPQTHGWAQLWFTTFFGTVFTQTLQVLVLELGSGLIGSSLQGAATPGTDLRSPIMTILLAIGVMHLARRVPRLVLNYVPGSGIALAGYLGLGSAQTILSGGGGRLASLVAGTAARGGARAAGGSGAGGSAAAGRSR